jgi:hypothetical protein
MTSFWATLGIVTVLARPSWHIERTRGCQIPQSTGVVTLRSWWILPRCGRGEVAFGQSCPNPRLSFKFGIGAGCRATFGRKNRRGSNAFHCHKVHCTLGELAFGIVAPALRSRESVAGGSVSKAKFAGSSAAG